MGRGIFIDAAALEQRPFRFNALIRQDRFDLSERWTVPEPVKVCGAATLLERQGRRIVRVQGRIRASIGCACDRCLVHLRREFHDSFDLCFLPKETLEEGGEEADVGFYEGEGLGLEDVVQEQIMLWLPVRNLCSAGCKGICPQCGANRNRSDCGCQDEFVDPRWDALRRLSSGR